MAIGVALGKVQLQQEYLCHSQQRSSGHLHPSSRSRVQPEITPPYCFIRFWRISRQVNSALAIDYAFEVHDSSEWFEFPVNNSKWPGSRV